MGGILASAMAGRVSFDSIAERKPNVVPMYPEQGQPSNLFTSVIILPWWLKSAFKIEGAF